MVGKLGFKLDYQYCIKVRNINMFIRFNNFCLKIGWRYIYLLDYEIENGNNCMVDVILYSV